MYKMYQKIFRSKTNILKTMFEILKFISFNSNQMCLSTESLLSLFIRPIARLVVRDKAATLIYMYRATCFKGYAAQDVQNVAYNNYNSLNSILYSLLLGVITILRL